MSRPVVGQQCNGTAVSPMAVCMVCDRQCIYGQYVLQTRPMIGIQTPFFPILESLSGTNSSQINCCRLCYQSLMNQWTDFESKQIPIRNRVYYLNATKPVVTTKTEPPMHTNHANNHKKHFNQNNNSAEEVLDLSLMSTSKPTSSSSTSSFQIPHQSAVPHSQSFGRYSNGKVGPSPPIMPPIVPPIVTPISPVPTHQIDRRDGFRNNDNQSYYELRINTDLDDSLLYSHSQRPSPMVQVRPSPSHIRNESHSSGGNHSTQNSRLSGFQSYRSGFEDNLRTTSSASTAPLPSLLMPSMPYESLPYPYHPLLPHSNPNLLPQQVLHPNSSYRLNENYHMDRFGLPREPLHMVSASLPVMGSGTTPSVPFNLLNSQTERLINIERQRLLNQTLSQSAYKPQITDSPPFHMTNAVNSNDRQLHDNNSEHHLTNHSISGSILSGTRRNPTPKFTGFSDTSSQKHVNISAIKPLNLSSNLQQMNSNCEPKYLWRPQSDDQRKQHIVKLNQNETKSSLRNTAIIDDRFHINSRLNSFDNNLKQMRKEDNIMIAQVSPVDENINNHNKHVLNYDNNVYCDSSKTINMKISDNSKKSLINNSITNISPEFTTNNKPEICAVNEREDKIISKLDLEEIKLKQKRVNNCFENGFSSESEEDSYDTDDSEESRYKYNIILTKRLPLELDTNREKMQFLGVFNLTTHKRKSQIEFNKYIKRRKILKQISPELENSNEKIDFKNEIKTNPETLIASQTLPDCIAMNEKNMDKKMEVMSAIGLCEQKSCKRQRDVEVLWSGIIAERLMRIKRHKCFTKVLNNLNEETLHKWLIGLQSDINHHFNVDSRLHSNGFIQNGYKNHKSVNNSFNSNSNRNKKVLLFNKQPKESLSVDNRSHNQSLLHCNKDFAQEFHESVLLETTRQQLKHNSKPEVNKVIVSDTHYEDIASTSDYIWPGIEVVMEAYDKHSYDRKQEKDFLFERSNELKTKLQDINSEAESLQKQMNNLLQTKSLLYKEKQKYEQTLETLNTCLRQLR